LEGVTNHESLRTTGLVQEGIQSWLVATLSIKTNMAKNKQLKPQNIS